ncbi:S8 family serine peptidase [Robiginitalea sp. SC105]|uniref:S8 family serine peptidase n=1 Tax=Robiginitalea sp. SC105 TaxID=2762332 RepID=UPI00163A9294|nr:S8 family serine peptidase [Robiginitalea sp. SC105]MBC2838309.1 S8 family serine peptidase [Robiginitalea sp. SC105]
MLKKLLLLFFVFATVGMFAQPSGRQATDGYSPNRQAPGQPVRRSARGWHHADWQRDSLPGISLDKAYTWLRENRGRQEGKEVVVAILDTKIDVNHEDIRDNLWTHPGEIPGNGLDDDGNGYTDDVHGWNFLGNSDGEDVHYQLRETARAARLLALADTAALGHSDPRRLATLRKYAAAYREDSSFFRHNFRLLDSIYGSYRDARRILEPLLGKRLRNRASLDSLAELQPGLEGPIDHFRDFILRYNLSDSLIQTNRETDSIQNRYFYNPDYDERAIIGDRPDDFFDRRYGNPMVRGRVPFEHAIGVAGVLAARRDQGLGVQGIANPIRIMPVVMVAEGDEHDKDVALAIRYAVDNGARIINMSWGKRQSLYPEWVADAIRYASERDVLLVHSAGNLADDLDAVDYYPLDYTRDGEFTRSFITVGALAPRRGRSLVARFSSYGQRNVDLFAPGDLIYTAQTGNTRAFKQGTSFAAPLVARVAALVWSYYPDFSAAEIKDILLASATRIDAEVYLPQKDEQAERELVPFSRLSRSGGILNAFAALQLAAVRNRERP